MMPLYRDSRASRPIRMYLRRFSMGGRGWSGMHTSPGSVGSDESKTMSISLFNCCGWHLKHTVGMFTFRVQPKFIFAQKAHLHNLITFCFYNYLQVVMALITTKYFYSSQLIYVFLLMDFYNRTLHLMTVKEVVNSFSYYFHICVFSDIKWKKQKHQTKKKIYGPLAEKQAQIITSPPPCLTAGMKHYSQTSPFWPHLSKWKLLCKFKLCCHELFFF